GRQAPAGHLADDAAQGRHPEFDLMPIGMPRNTDVIKGDLDVLAVAIRQRDPLIGNLAVPRCPLQGFIQPLRRSEHVVKQTDLSEIEILAEMKSQEVILQRLRGKLQKLDLISNVDASGAILHLLLRQSGLAQQPLACRPRAARPQPGDAGNPAGGGREGPDMIFGMTHGGIAPWTRGSTSADRHKYLAHFSKMRRESRLYAGR